MSKASGSIDLKSLKVAGSSATDYITQIDNGGIKVHDANDNLNYTCITSDGLEIFKTNNATSTPSSISVASFGTTARIGVDTEEHLEITSNNFEFKNKEQNSVFDINLISGNLDVNMTYDCGQFSRTRMTNHTISRSRSLTNVSKILINQIDFEINHPSLSFVITGVQGTNCTATCVYPTSSGSSSTMGKIHVTPNTTAINVTSSGSTSYTFTITTNVCTIAVTNKITYSSSLIKTETTFVTSNVTSYLYGKNTITAIATACYNGQIMAPSYTIGNRYIDDTTINGGYSVAMGFGLKAATDYQVVLGQYNNNSNNNIFEIGNGTDDTNRSNIFEITNTGTVMAGGSIKVKGHDGYIGDYESKSNSTTMGSGAPSTGNYRTTGVYFSLTKGVYILIGRISFESNTTGRRIAVWGYGDSQTYSLLDHSLSNQMYVTNAATNVQTIAIAAPGSTQTYRLLGRQESGTTLDINAYARIIRIR